jgi:hypothetical protein
MLPQRRSTLVVVSWYWLLLLLFDLNCNNHHRLAIIVLSINWLVLRCCPRASPFSSEGCFCCDCISYLFDTNLNLNSKNDIVSTEEAFKKSDQTKENSYDSNETPRPPTQIRRKKFNNNLKLDTQMRFLD